MPVSDFVVTGGSAGKLKKLAEVSAKAGGKLKNMRPAMKQVSVFLDAWVQQNFRTEGGKVGGWEPFKAGGRYIRGTLDTSAKLLQDTGALRASYRAFASSNNAGIGSRLPYAETHEEGIGVPARRMVPEGPDVSDEVRDILASYVEDSVTDPIEKAFRR